MESLMGSHIILCSSPCIPESLEAEWTLVPRFRLATVSEAKLVGFKVQGMRILSMGS